MKVEISKYYLKKCEQFAQKQLKTSKSLYAYRGEKNVNKMYEDIIVGKMAEIAVYKYLKDCGKEVSKPDFTIYERANKSFDADLSMPSCKIHVKSQGIGSATRYGKSWLVQKSDKITKADQNGDNILVFCVVDGMEVEILGAVVSNDMANYCLDEPKVLRYRHTKYAIYWDKLKKYNCLKGVIKNG